MSDPLKTYRVSNKDLTVLVTDASGETFDLNATGQPCENATHLLLFIDELHSIGAFDAETAALLRAQVDVPSVVDEAVEALATKESAGAWSKVGDVYVIPDLMPGAWRASVALDRLYTELDAGDDVATLVELGRTEAAQRGARAIVLRLDRTAWHELSRQIDTPVGNADDLIRYNGMPVVRVSDMEAEEGRRLSALRNTRCSSGPPSLVTPGMPEPRVYGDPDMMRTHEATRRRIEQRRALLPGDSDAPVEFPDWFEDLHQRALRHPFVPAPVLEAGDMAKAILDVRPRAASDDLARFMGQQDPSWPLPGGSVEPLAAHRAPEEVIPMPTVKRRERSWKALAETFFDKDLVQRAVRNAGHGEPTRRPRWAHVRDVFGVGPTRAADLCARFGLNADEEIGGEDEDAPAWTRDDAVTLDLLRMVGTGLHVDPMPTFAIIPTPPQRAALDAWSDRWASRIAAASDETVKRLEDWAGAVHFAASDNDVDVDVPEFPSEITNPKQEPTDGNA